MKDEGSIRTALSGFVQFILHPSAVKSAHEGDCRRRPGGLAGRRGLVLGLRVDSQLVVEHGREIGGGHGALGR